MADVSAADYNLLQEAKDVLPEITVTEWTPELKPTALGGDDKNGESEQASQEDEAAEILRQMEHYFSEENLPHDAHLLGLFEDGEGTVSFNEVCSFKALRTWARTSKQKTRVKEVLKRSELIEVVGNSKHPRIRRKVPLETAPTITPRVRRDGPAAKVVPADKPWLTKGMMKPTGFEEGAEDDATPDDDTAYPPDESFTQRIETAIARFCARRKMHQDVRKIFDKFLTYGGLRGGQAQFIGGLNGKAEDDLTAKEKAERSAHYGIAESVLDGLDDGTPPTWTVDFVEVVKGFLSSHFTAYFAWYDQGQVKTATNVLRNFNRYLLIHKLCPEYEDQITAAIEVCNVAEKEFPKLAMVDKHLPGGFNVACSMLFYGHHSNQLAQGDWAQGTEGGSWNVEEAWSVFRTSVFAHGSKEQIAEVELAKGDRNYFGPASDLKVGLEMVTIEMPDKTAQGIYDAASEKSSIIKPMGKLRCREWGVPSAPPRDLPPDVRDARRNPDPNFEYEFLLEASTLEFCYPGCKFEAVVKQLKPGFIWIDYLETTYASFFTWLANEKIREWKEPGPPKEWMVRQNEKRDNGVGMELETVPDGDEELGW